MGPSIAIAMGLAKISSGFNALIINVSIINVSKVLLSSYILKHNGIDCGF